MPSIGGPSSGSMMPSFSPGQGTNLDKGREISHAEMAAQQRYTTPTQFDPTSAGISGAGRPEGQYNTQQAPAPVKYYVPGPEDQYLQNREAIRKAAGSKGVAVTRVDPITDREVALLQQKKDQAEVADFDRYVNSLINPRKPGELQWLMSVYPEFVQRRIEQVHQDYEFAVRNQMIDMWGINTKDDLMFKYLVDQKKVDGPRLGRHKPIDDQYAPGLLSPYRWAFNGDSTGPDLFAPFSSAQDGAKPGADGWKFEGPRAMGSARGTRDMAQSLYANTTAGGAVRDRPVGYTRSTPA
jgi:hypothetical protein